MLHDPGSYSPPQRYSDIRLAASEKEILRRLGQETAAVAALPVHREKAGLWRKLNDLAVRAAHGLDQRDSLARDERRRRAHPSAPSTRGPGSWRRACAARCTSGATCPGTWC